MEKGKRIAEGKTKIIWSFNDPSQFFNLVYIESKDDITAGDGFWHDVIKGKGAFCTRTAANVFLSLQRHGIPNHFVRLVDEKTFLARRLLLMPMEIVVRRKAAGSFCQRHSEEIVIGTVFKEPIVEFYLKDDQRHDPIIIWNGERDQFELYNAHIPISSDGFMGNLNPEQYVKSLGSLKDFCVVPMHFSDLIAPKNLARGAFIVIEREWQQQDYVLSDFKIEVGWNQLGELEIGDVIGNDEWRLQLQQNKEEVSKQCYRDLKEVTSEALVEIRRKYELVADASDSFLR